MESGEFATRNLLRGFSNALKSGQAEVDKSEPPRQRLERSLSDQVECEDALAAILRNAASKLVISYPAPCQLGLTRLSSPKASAALQKQFEKLKKTVDEFNELFPHIAKEGGAAASLSWTSLNQTILRLKDQYEAKSGSGFRGKTKKQFHAVCATLNDHTSFLNFLPRDEYMAPICGSLEIIVKVLTATTYIASS